MLPKRKNPKILDIGCGTGVPTLELAKISDGQIIAIDIDQDALDVLSKYIENLGLTDRIKVLNRSLLDLGFSNERFDIIWAEGVLQFIGFEKALQNCLEKCTLWIYTWFHFAFHCLCYLHEMAYGVYLLWRMVFPLAYCL